MKPYINAILLVEGQHDKSRILTIFDCEILVCNGYDVDRRIIEYLTAVNDFKKIIIFTDPDEAGRKINDNWKTLIPFAESLSVDINKCNKRNKHGVAECSLEEIEKTLKPYIENKPNNSITKLDLYDLDLIGKNRSKLLREKVCEKYHVLNDSTSTFLNCLNSLKITKEEIWKFLETI